ncbi:phage baseplate plug family protein [Serratia quinivorans]|uniref:phage baseplate plug family protein n=1 Tax=Serratia quinivorans TaxID=137545 RepID=UPI003F9A00C3
MQTITLQPIKAQQVGITLGGQDCQIRLVQRTTGLFIDVALNGLWIVQGVICLNCNKLVRYEHLGLQGELFFADTIGDADPVFDELGTRFQLLYATKEEMESN